MQLVFLLVVSLCLFHGTRAEPYVLYDEYHKYTDGTAGFSLCLGSEPSEKLRTSLLMCRELSYQFCVNSSLVGSVLRVDGSTAQHFVKSLSDPTEENIERLAWLVDAALVLLYDSFTTSSVNSTCAHEWRAWVCSRAFRRSGTATEHAFPLPLCAAICERAEDACNTDLQCAARHDVHYTTKDQCTDFYRDSGETCQSVHKKSVSGDAIGTKSQSVPVFREHKRHKYYDSAAIGMQKPNFYLLSASTIIAFAARLACR